MKNKIFVIVFDDQCIFLKSLLHLCHHQIENHRGEKRHLHWVRLQLHDKEFVPHGLVEEVTARGHRLRRQSLTIYGTTTEHKHILHGPLGW